MSEHENSKRKTLAETLSDLMQDIPVEVTCSSFRSVLTLPLVEFERTTRLIFEAEHYETVSEAVQVFARAIMDVNRPSIVPKIPD